MDTTAIHAALAGSLAGTCSFPQHVQHVAAAGAQRYTVDLATLCCTYYGSSNEAHTEPLPLPGSPAIAADFDTTAVQAAIRNIQAKQIDYIAFLHAIMVAGCTQYQVFISGCHVIYFGRHGHMYVEPLPTPAI